MCGMPVGLGAKRTRIIVYIILESTMATLTETAIGVRKLIKVKPFGPDGVFGIKIGPVYV